LLLKAGGPRGGRGGPGWRLPGFRLGIHSKEAWAAVEAGPYCSDSYKHSQSGSCRLGNFFNFSPGALEGSRDAHRCGIRLPRGRLLQLASKAGDFSLRLRVCKSDAPAAAFRKRAIHDSSMAFVPPHLKSHANRFAEAAICCVDRQSTGGLLQKPTTCGTSCFVTKARPLGGTPVETGSRGETVGADPTL